MWFFYASLFLLFCWDFLFCIDFLHVVIVHWRTFRMAALKSLPHNFITSVWASIDFLFFFFIQFEIFPVLGRMGNFYWNIDILVVILWDCCSPTEREFICSEQSRAKHWPLRIAVEELEFLYCRTPLKEKGKLPLQTQTTR